MGRDIAYASICAQMNSAITAQEVMEYLQYHPDKVVRSGEVYLALCPIHGETVFRTLVLNPRNNTYQCRYSSCAGNNASDFLDLIVRVTGKELAMAMLDLVAHYGAPKFSLTERQLATLGKLARNEVGGEPEEGSEGEPRAPIPPQSTA